MWPKQSCNASDIIGSGLLTFWIIVVLALGDRAFTLNIYWLSRKVIKVRRALGLKPVLVLDIIAKQVCYLNNANAEQGEHGITSWLRL